jgi:signal transduction histidine kinase
MIDPHSLDTETGLLAALARVAALLSDVVPAALLPTIVRAAREFEPDRTRGVRLYVATDLGPAGNLVPAAHEGFTGDEAAGVPSVVWEAYTHQREVVVLAADAGGPLDSLATALVLPLGTGLTAAGVLVIDLDPGPAPTGPHREAYRLLAHLLGAALETDRLRRAASRDAALDKMLEQISAEVSSTLSLNDILLRILTHLSGAIAFTGGSIALVTPRNELEMAAAIGEIDDAARRVRLPVGQGISGWVAAHGQPYLSNNLDEEDNVRPVGRSVGTNRNIRSYMAAPLLVEGQVIGILQVNSPEVNAFSPDDVALLSQVAGRCASAVAQARLFAELRARAERLAILNAISRRLSSKLDLDELFSTCYDQVRRVMTLDAFFVALYDPDHAVLRYEFQADAGVIYPKSQAAMGEGLTSYVVQSGASLVCSHRANWPAAVTPVPFGSAQQSQSLLLVPLIFEQRVLGAMSAQSYEAHAYSEQDVRLFTTLASQTAVAIRNAELYQSERAAQRAKTEFLSLISHELKTPLTSIKGTAQMMTRRILKAYSAGQLADPVQDQARQADIRSLSLVIGQVDRLTRLVDDLLDISRLQSGRFELFPTSTDLVRVVRGVVDSLRPTSPAHRLLLDVPPVLPGVFDPLRIEQVLTNLINNAIKYSPSNTEIQVWVRQEDGAAVVCVIDQGPGLSAEEQVRIFERYFRAEAGRRAPGSGLGLGLYISRQLVEHHGGAIWVESAPDAGATFCFRLPLDGTVAFSHRRNQTDDLRAPAPPEAGAEQWSNGNIPPGR